MKKTIAILTILLSLLIVLPGCSVDQPVKVVPEDKVKDITKSGIRDKSQWEEYQNTRFGFEISFPKEWYQGNTSQNNDGVILHTDNSNFDIRVYASNYLAGFSNPFKLLEKKEFSEEDIILEGGEKATLIKGEEDNMSVYEMVFVTDKFEYHFYAKVTKEYAQEYEDVILNVIRTFNPNIEGEEKESEDAIAKKAAIKKVKDILEKDKLDYRDVLYDFEKDNNHIIMVIKTIVEENETEPIVQKTWYVIDKETGKIVNTVVGGVGAEKSITPEKLAKAEKLVISELDMNDSPLTGVKFDHMKEGNYIVRAYEIVEAGTETGHVATTGWYIVDIVNEKVKSMF